MFANETDNSQHKTSDFSESSKALATNRYSVDFLTYDCKMLLSCLKINMGGMNRTEVKMKTESIAYASSNPLIRII